MTYTQEEVVELRNTLNRQARIMFWYGVALGVTVTAVLSTVVISAVVTNLM
jgi:hypothetical protein